MVVIDSNLCEKTGLFSRTVILGVVLNIGNCGSLEVNVDRELKCVVEVGVLAAVSVVKVTLDKAGELRVVFELLVNGIKADLYVCGVDRTAVAVGLADVFFNL